MAMCFFIRDINVKNRHYKGGHTISSDDEFASCTDIQPRGERMHFG